MNDTRDSLPEMLDPNDVCSAMDDLAFMEYCYSHFDVNHDHKVGLHEARAVREIDLSDSKVVSLHGIEYFSNLERLILDRSTVRELHLLQNTKLKEISAKGCTHLNYTELPNGLSAIPNNEIWYTSTDGKIIEPHKADAFGANIVSNTYENGKGIISFDGDVTAIGRSAFWSCTSLTSITIPDNVTSIGDGAFLRCTSLESITIPNSVITIGDGTFGWCTSLERIVVTEGNPVYDSREGCNAIIKTETNALIAGCKTTVITESVTEIGKEAFFGCDSLESITIPESVTAIGEDAFSGCTSLERIVVTEGNSVYDSREGCNAIIRTEKNALVVGCITTVIPESVTRIGFSAFRGCTSLESITIPNSVTAIGGRAFSDCTSLESITLPESVTEIGVSAFSGCDSLESITIPEAVTEIGEWAFARCTSLTSVTIPDSLTEIEKGAFSGCTSLTDVYCKPKTPPTLGVDFYGRWMNFDKCASNCKIYVPRKSVAAYKSAEGWKEYADYIVGYDFEE